MRICALFIIFGASACCSLGAHSAVTIAVAATPPPPCPACPTIASTPADATAPPPMIVATQDDASPPPPAILATVSADLDGDGVVEEVRLLSDGALRVYHGTVEVTTDDDPAAQIHDFAEEVADDSTDGPPSLAVVDIDRRDHQRELVFSMAVGDEDPPAKTYYFVYRDGVLYNMLRDSQRAEPAIWVPSGFTPRIPGDGTITVVYTRCVLDGGTETHRDGIEEHITQRFHIADGPLPRGELIEHLQTTRHPSHCIQVG